MRAFALKTSWQSGSENQVFFMRRGNQTGGHCALGNPGSKHHAWEFPVGERQRLHFDFGLWNVPDAVCLLLEKARVSFSPGQWRKHLRIGRKSARTAKKQRKLKRFDWFHVFWSLSKQHLCFFAFEGKNHFSMQDELKNGRVFPN